MLELLAPAGDMEAFDVALASGADAVYLGLDNFNARMKAQNFDCDNIAQVVSRAHFYGVKVYVTINTILQNCEFKELIELVKAALTRIDWDTGYDLSIKLVLLGLFLAP
jgi:putative protease